MQPQTSRHAYNTNLIVQTHTCCMLSVFWKSFTASGPCGFVVNHMVSGHAVYMLRAADMMRKQNASVSSPWPQSTTVVRGIWRGDLHRHFNYLPFLLSAFIISLVQIPFVSKFLFCFACGQNLAFHHPKTNVWYML